MTWRDMFKFKPPLILARHVQIQTTTHLAVLAALEV
jgi:hypothetical protein